MTEKTRRKKKLTARDIKNLSGREIDKIQEDIDAENMRIIAEAYAQKRITKEEKEYLETYYRNGMESYRKVYVALYNIFNVPARIVCIDPESGEVEAHTKTYFDKKTKKRKRKEIETSYDFKEITPFTCMRLEYYDKDNPISLILPVMKSPERAIEKLEDYRKEYLLKQKEAEENYNRHSDIERYQQELSGIKQPYERLNDVLRFTITRKYYSGVEDIVKTFTENEDMNINPEETRSLFKENDMKNKEDYLKNNKSYFDFKMFLHLVGENDFMLNAEAQIKINLLYIADLKTHKIYEEQRRIEEDLKRRRDTMAEEEIRQTEARIKILKMSIQKINKEAIHEYNLMVLNNVNWVESGYKAMRIPPDLPDGTYKVCRQMIQKEYMVRPFKAFDVDKEFSPDDELNQEIAKRNNYDLNEINALARRYQNNVSVNLPRTGKKNSGADKEYIGIAAKYRYHVGGTHSSENKAGNSEKSLDISNKNIYKENYTHSAYWKDYDKAEEASKDGAMEDEINAYQAILIKKVVAGR